MKTDAATCPRCGKVNQCAQRSPDRAAKDCWCFRVEIPPTLLATYKDQARCLCAACIANHWDEINQCRD